MSRRAGRPLEWTNERLLSAVSQSRVKNGKIIIVSGDGFKRAAVYTALCRSVKKGEFSSAREATERLWLRGITTFNMNGAACWVVDTVMSGTAKDVKLLNKLIETEKDCVAKILKEIFRPCYPVAARRVKEFLRTKRGKTLRSFIAQDPDLSRKVGVRY